MRAVKGGWERPRRRASARCRQWETGTGSGKRQGCNLMTSRSLVGILTQISPRGPLPSMPPKLSRGCCSKSQSRTGARPCLTGSECHVDGALVCGEGQPLSADKISWMRMTNAGWENTDSQLRPWQQDFGRPLPLRVEP